MSNENEQNLTNTLDSDTSTYSVTKIPEALLDGELDSNSDSSITENVSNSESLVDSLQSDSNEESEIMDLSQQKFEDDSEAAITDAQPKDELDVLDDPSEASQVQAEVDEFTLQDKLVELEKRRAEVKVNINEFMDLSDKHQEKIEELVATREDLNQWIEARKESFAWRFVEKLRESENNLIEGEKTLKEFSNSPQSLDIEFSVKTRKWVMRSLGWGFLVTIGIGYLVEIVRRYSDMVNVPDPNNPANNVSVNAFDQWLINYFGITTKILYFILGVILILFYIGIFSAYSRRTSEFRQVVAQETHKTKVMENATYSIKAERERIDSLHPQALQILELLSLGLHQPWKISSQYSNFKGTVPDTTKIPESLDIAAPTERSIHKVFTQLIFRAMNELQKPGWREKAFKTAIQKLSEGAGFGQADSALKELDQDQRRNGKRQILISLEDKESVLLEIGDQLVREFAATVQEKVLPEYQPEVTSLRPDALADLLLSDSLVQADEENVSPWEVKLAEISVAPPLPWAPSTYSTRGKIAARHENKPESVFIATDRVCKHAHKDVGPFNEVHAGTRPFEVSIRVDMSDWCHPEEVAIFQDYQPTQEELDARDQKISSATTKIIEFADNFDEVAL